MSVKYRGSPSVAPTRGLNGPPHDIRGAGGAGGRTGGEGAVIAAPGADEPGLELLFLLRARALLPSR